MISIAEKIDVPSPPQRVWEVISDPSAVVSCIGGAELGESHEDGSFDAELVVKFGGIRVRFAARVALELDESEREGRLTARGRDGQGATRFSGGAVFRVTGDPAALGAQVVMSGEMTLSGKLAPLIESGAGVVVKKMTREFSAALVELCAAPASAVSGDAATVAPATVAAAPTDSGTTSAAPSVRPTRWQRIRERLARLLGRGRSAERPVPPDPPETAAQPSSVTRPASTSSRGGRP